MIYGLFRTLIWLGGFHTCLVVLLSMIILPGALSTWSGLKVFFFNFDIHPNKHIIVSYVLHCIWFGHIQIPWTISKGFLAFSIMFLRIYISHLALVTSPYIIFYFWFILQCVLFMYPCWVLLDMEPVIDSLLSHSSFSRLSRGVQVLVWRWKYFYLLSVWLYRVSTDCLLLVIKNKPELVIL